MRTIYRISAVAAVFSAAFTGAMLLHKPTTSVVPLAPPHAVCITDPHVKGNPLFAEYPCTPGALGYVDGKEKVHLTANRETRDLALTKLIKMHRALDAAQSKN